MLYWRI